MSSPELIRSPSAPTGPSTPAFATRRLAAVWFADIVGYTGLTAQDENAALHVVEVFQDRTRQEIDRYGGRLVKFLGDGAMAEFHSTDAAVRSAVALRRVFRSSTQGGGIASLRIGIHLGDVVTASDGDIYGDGVNTASRLAKEASPGKILVSEDVWRQLRQQPEFSFRSAGERALRGIQGRVRLFEVSLPERTEPPASVDRRSIAVLPFTDTSPARDNEYFSDGIAEELIAALVHVEGLHVASRTSSFSFKGKDLTIREIGEKLGVATILEGSVRKDGDRVRITPQLVAVEDGYQLWSDTFATVMGDVFEVQEKISRAIVDALQVELKGPADEPLVRRSTTDLDAYNLYLRGKYHWNRHSFDELSTSIECFESAIAIDPDYALAYAGLAHSYLTLGALFLPPLEAYPKARKAAERALELDSKLAEAHAALAEIMMRFEWDWEAAERGFQQAIQLDPVYADGSRVYANYLRDMGRMDEAIVEIRRAQALDPPSLPISVAVAGIYYFARRYDEAIEECRRVLQEAPFFFQAFFYLGFSHEQKGEYAEAEAALEKLAKLSGIPSAIAALGHLYATAGRHDEANAIVEELEKRSKTEYVTPYSFARLYVALGDLDEAFTWFDRACAERSNWLTSLKVEPGLDPVRADPRFVALLEEVGLIEPPASVPVNLPTPPTPLVGRKTEMAEIRRILLDPDVRLLTLTGVGGTGKTRLALEVARTLASECPDGVHFVPLATVKDGELVPTAIARTLNLQEWGDQTPLQALSSHLPGKRLLLVLDSFEQVMDAVAQIAELLEFAPGAKLLVTSREPLRIRGEHEYQVGSLALPDPGTAIDPARALQAEAVGLFVQRARAAKPSFQLTGENASDVVEICRRLDGLPLAIELAAARCKHMSPKVMLRRLADRFAFLTEGPRDVPEHQRTLRGAFDWSYDLLNSDERALFRHVSIFVGGFTIEAAEQVAQLADQREFHVLDGLTSLVDKSLLRQVEGPDGEPRFEMLETIREYGFLLLREGDEIELARRRHADFFLELAKRAELRLEGPDQCLWFDLLEAEHSNVQAAMDWLLGRGEIETAVRIGTALWWFWWVRGHLGEMRWRMEQGLARSGTLPKALRANLLLASGVLISLDGDHERAGKLFEEAVALERERRDRTGIPRALRGFGLLISDRGEYARASVLFEEALVLDREFGDQHGESSDLRALGKMQLHLGNPALAKEHFEEALALGQALGDRHGAAFSLAALGDAARHDEDHDLAARMYREAHALFRELGSKPGIASSLNDLAETERLRGDLTAAVELFGEALELLVALGHRLQIADCVAGLAAIALAKEQAERAARLYGVVESLRENARLVLSPADHAEYETTRAAAVVALGDEGFEQALGAGKALSYEQGIRLAEESVELFR